MKDEEYVFRQDVKEKASTARSARYKRTHNGKSGRVKFPSDNLSRKEINAMNGEVKSYRLNEPMKWAEFRAMPDDLKVSYINAIRAKFHVPDNEIAGMFGVDRVTVGKWFRCLGLGLGKSAGGKKPWDKEGFLAWCNGAPIPAADPVEEAPDAAELPEAERQMASLEDIATCEHVPVHIPEVKVLPVRKEKAIPASGSMTFEGSVESILNTLSVLLGGADVHISVTWDVLSEGCEGG